jgi:ABC-type transporter MlaC component
MPRKTLTQENIELQQQIKEVEKRKLEELGNLKEELKEFKQNNEIMIKYLTEEFTSLVDLLEKGLVKLNQEVKDLKDKNERVPCMTIMLINAWERNLYDYSNCLNELKNGHTNSLRYMFSVVQTSKFMYFPK